MGAEARAAGRTRRRRRLSDARRRRRSSSNGRWPPPSASVWSFLRLTHCAGGIAAASWVRAVSLGSTSAARRNPARPRSPRTRPVRPRSALAARCPDEGDRRRAQRPAGTAVLPEPLFCHPPGQEILTARSRRGQVEPAAARATPREPAARLAAPDLIRLGPTAGASNLSRRLPDMSAGIRLGAPLGRTAQNARRRHPTGPALLRFAGRSALADAAAVSRADRLSHLAVSVCTERPGARPSASAYAAQPANDNHTNPVRRPSAQCTPLPSRG